MTSPGVLSTTEELRALICAMTRLDCRSRVRGIQCRLAVLVVCVAIGVVACGSGGTRANVEVEPVLGAVAEARKDRSATVHVEISAIGRYAAEELTSTGTLEVRIIFGEAASVRETGGDTGGEVVVTPGQVFHPTPKRLESRGVTTPYVRVRGGATADEGMLILMNVLDEITERATLGSNSVRTTADGQSEVELVSTDDESVWTVTLTSHDPPQLASVAVHIPPGEPEKEGDLTVESTWLLTFERFGGADRVPVPGPREVTIVESLGRP